MRNDEKERLKSQTEKQYLWLRFKNGCKSLKDNKAKCFILLAFYAVVILIWIFHKDRFNLEHVYLISPAFVALSKLALPITLIGSTILILILLGTPVGTGKITNGLQRIGLTNSAGETPILTAKTKDEKQSEVMVFEFDGVGIPLTEWENKRQRIEAALNVHIVKLTEGKNKRSILLCTVPAGNQLSSRIEWSDSYLIKDSSTLVLGKSLLGTVTVDLAKIPHISSWRLYRKWQKCALKIAAYAGD